MKSHIHIISVLFISAFISLTACHKDDAKKATLPEATQSGKNTLGFMLNGNVWLPSYKCSFGGSNCGELEAGYGLPLVPGHSFTVTANRRIDKLSSLNMSVKPGASISGTGDKTDSIRVVYTGEEWAGSTLPGRYIGPLPGSKFTVTKLDVEGKVISGTFDLIVADSVNSSSQLTLTNGRFDFQFYTCRCGN